MSMTNYTLISKKHHCSMWNIDLSITAKYYFFDAKKPYIAKYVSCTCPIIENLKQPIFKQNKEYSLFRFCKMKQTCLNNIAFPLEIDVSKDNHSQ